MPALLTVDVPAKSPSLWVPGAVEAVGSKSALTRGSLGVLGRNMHADDAGVSRGRVKTELGEESALFVAPSATSGGVVAHSCLVGAHSGQTNKIQISTVAFLVRSGQIRR